MFTENSKISKEKNKNPFRWILKHTKELDKKHGYFRITGLVLRKAIPLVTNFTNHDHQLLN